MTKSAFCRRVFLLPNDYFLEKNKHFSLCKEAVDWGKMFLAAMFVVSVALGTAQNGFACLPCLLDLWLFIQAVKMGQFLFLLFFTPNSSRLSDACGHLLVGRAPHSKGSEYMLCIQLNIVK